MEVDERRARLPLLRKYYSWHFEGKRKRSQPIAQDRRPWSVITAIHLPFLLRTDLAASFTASGVVTSLRANNP
jgi:hypothetical protein